MLLLFFFKKLIGSGASPKVEPFRVFGKGFWHSSEVSEGAVDLFDGGAAAAPGAGRDPAYRRYLLDPKDAGLTPSVKHSHLHTERMETSSPEKHSFGLWGGSGSAGEKTHTYARRKCKHRKDPAGI